MKISQFLRPLLIEMAIIRVDCKINLWKETSSGHQQVFQLKKVDKLRTWMSLPSEPNPVLKSIKTYANPFHPFDTNYSKHISWNLLFFQSFFLFSFSYLLIMMKNILIFKGFFLNFIIKLLSWIWLRKKVITYYKLYFDDKKNLILNNLIDKILLTFLLLKC